jgi:hypothetical protein
LGERRTGRVAPTPAMAMGSSRILFIGLLFVGSRRASMIAQDCTSLSRQPETQACVRGLCHDGRSGAVSRKE